ncbi:MAG: hypothetical protein JSV78_08780 [Phycisphaerales bacterium]|nr:MAG: hypothetical protein JSV78_08780 [Phycisphaerales bacterium]
MMGAGSETVAAESVGKAVALYGCVGLTWLAFFSWLAVVGWAIQRRKEREAFYRHETEKRLLEQGDASAEQFLQLRREEERTRWLRRREGLKVGGLITGAIGLGILLGLRFVDTGALSFSAVGWIPLGIGLVLVLYAYVLYPESPSLGRGAPPAPSGGETDDRHD